MSDSTSIKLRPGLRDRIRALAEDQHRTPNQLMNDALDDYVERAEERSKFLREAEAAHQDFLENGLHVTQQEMDAWFDGIQRGEDPPLPKPHT
jgi:predicted transcriptional regulator